ncbi:hypothetical protein HPP92_025139 [Vanilla planifolia]|uniref:Uncharacterized protein n=2 Tax=Vanilla planifolia TaxID=51239 RepID=A0A835PHF5_VANPL|nr:hypothetical protein HPP92_025139 [Vanilla planifolia]
MFNYRKRKRTKVLKQFTEFKAETKFSSMDILVCNVVIYIQNRWVVDHMIELGFSKSLSDWIGSNLKKSGDCVTWAFDLQAAIAMFNSYREADYWRLLEHPPFGLEIAVVRAEKSDRWSRHVLEKLEYLSAKERKAEEGKVTLHVLPNSGHWVHVDNPTGLLEIMVPNFIAKT